MGFPSTPDMVFQNLVSNPAFARVCGFNPNISNNRDHGVQNYIVTTV